MAQDTVLTISVKQEVADRIASLEQRTGRSRQELLEAAIERYVEFSDWEIAEIEESIRQADAGEFATDEEVAAALRRWRP